MFFFFLKTFETMCHNQIKTQHMGTVQYDHRQAIPNTLSVRAADDSNVQSFGQMFIVTLIFLPIFLKTHNKVL